MEIAKLILHYNTPEVTSRLCAMVPDSIVIDNGSDIPFSSVMPEHTVYRFEDNLGFTRNWNRALRHLMHMDHTWYDAYWLMNSDIEIAPASIRRIEQLMDECVYDMITPAYNCWMPSCRNNGSPGVREVTCIEFTAPVISRWVFDRIGFFNETFERGYGVEFDWALRMRAAGLKLCCDDGSVFHHLGQQTINTVGTLVEYEEKAKEELNDGMIKLYGYNWRLMLKEELQISAFMPRKKKIAVYTTIFNDYAKLYNIPVQSVDADFYCITDDINAIMAQPSPGGRDPKSPRWQLILVSYPNHGLHPRMRAKFFKMFPWEAAALSGYDTVIFIDGSIEITSGDFVKFMVESCTGDIALYRHPQRDCIYEEAKASQELIKYIGQDINAQTNFYMQLYPPHGGLWACGVMVRKIGSPRIRELMAKWWWENIKWTYQDQISFPVICKLMGILPEAIPGHQYKNPFFKIHWHDDTLAKILPIHAN